MSNDLLLSNLMAQMSEAAKSRSTTHIHFAGPWLDLVWHLIKTCPGNPTFDMFRDEFLDDDACTLGMKGDWLRRRTYETDPSRPRYTLKTALPAQGQGVTYTELSNLGQINERLGVVQAWASFPKIVCHYNCLRVTHETPTVSIHFEIARLKADLFYLLATATELKTEASVALLKPMRIILTPEARLWRLCTSKTTNSTIDYTMPACLETGITRKTTNPS